MIEYAQLLHQHKALQRSVKGMLTEYNYMKNIQKLLYEANEDLRGDFDILKSEHDILTIMHNQTMAVNAKLIDDHNNLESQLKFARKHRDELAIALDKNATRNVRLVRWNQRYVTTIIIMFVAILFLIAMLLG